jgi:hypothetical protein
MEEQLAELLAQLGVSLEDPTGGEPIEGATRPHTSGMTGMTGGAFSYGVRQAGHDTPATWADGAEPSGESTGEIDDELTANITAVAEMSLFQTSREHYGVFYRLDLVAGVPQLRIYTPEDEGALKMGCYLVRAAQGTPLHAWFHTVRVYDGSRAYEDARDSGQQHLLFAAGELMKRLFWAGDLERMRFAEEIAVVRLA